MDLMPQPSGWGKNKPYPNLKAGASGLCASVPLFHAWFGTKRRKWQGDVAEEVKKLLHSIAKEHGIRLLECETMPDHVHLLLEAGSPEELSRAMNLLKGASSRRLFQALPDVKLDGGTSALWQHRYAAKPVPPSAATSVGTYIRTQWERLDNYDR